MEAGLMAATGRAIIVKQIAFGFSVGIVRHPAVAVFPEQVIMLISLQVQPLQ